MREIYTAFRLDNSVSGRTSWFLLFDQFEFYKLLRNSIKFLQPFYSVNGLLIKGGEGEILQEFLFSRSA